RLTSLPPAIPAQDAIQVSLVSPHHTKHVVAPPPAVAEENPRHRSPQRGATPQGKGTTQHTLSSSAARRGAVRGTHKTGNPGPRIASSSRPRFRNAGGGSPAPAKHLAGKGGAWSLIRPIEPVLYSGGGRGGANLPRATARAGGGAGKAPATQPVP